MTNPNVKVVKPQPGYQETVLSSNADILISGSAAGVGKTFGLLLEPLYHIGNEKFNAVCFRRTSPMITGEGGLWDTSKEIYYNVGAKPNESSLRWTFPSGCTLKFSHLQYEKDLQNWQGNQICLLLFDELCQFSEKQFFYLLSRNRSVCGVKPYVRATCNPDPDSWVKRFISWWIDKETGFPIPEREGVIRYFANDGGNYIWGDTRKEVLERIPHVVEKLEKVENFDPSTLVKSVTFVAGNISDNKELLSKNPEYLGNLNALSEQDKAALLEGNWNIIKGDDFLFDPAQADQIEFNSWVYDEQEKEKLTDSDKYITADIALMGSDIMVLWVWHGFTIIDVIIIDKEIQGPEALKAIEDTAHKYKVLRKNISFDRDGIGGYLKGYLSFSHDIVNNSRPKFKENFTNLKAQMFYVTAEILDKIYILPSVAAKTMVTQEGTQRIIDVLKKQLRAIRKKKNKDDGKQGINSKEEQKNILGCSPDLADAFAQRGYFYKVYNK